LWVWSKHRTAQNCQNKTHWVNWSFFPSTFIFPL
jgi:hypothetical protein